MSCSFLLYAGGEVNFDDLSADEKKQFLGAVASGELSKNDWPMGSLVAEAFC